MPATFELAAAAMFVAVAVAIPLGIAAAVWRGTAVDHGATTLSLLGISIPNFWLGPLLGLRVENPGGHIAYPFGFGMGWATARNVDLRTWFMFPDMNREAAARTWGVGIGLEVRFE